MPAEKDIKNIKLLLVEAFTLLEKNDSDLFSLPPESEVDEYENATKKYERKLHEVCINHRLAHYIEILLPRFFDGEYHVDIEYNRYYKNKKCLDINNNGVLSIVRPDIIVHTRTLKTNPHQHLLVIEAKKHHRSLEDEKKVKAFITDTHYEYVFGATIQYNNLSDGSITLYYKDDTRKVISELIFTSNHPI